MEINDFVENKMVRNQSGNLVKRSLQEIVTWVKNLWDEIADSCLTNASRAGYLGKKCSFNENSSLDMRDLGRRFCIKWNFTNIPLPLKIRNPRVCSRKTLQRTTTSLLLS